RALAGRQRRRITRQDGVDDFRREVASQALAALEQAELLPHFVFEAAVEGPQLAFPFLEPFKRSLQGMVFDRELGVDLGEPRLLLPELILELRELAPFPENQEFERVATQYLRLELFTLPLHRGSFPQKLRGQRSAHLHAHHLAKSV